MDITKETLFQNARHDQIRFEEVIERIIKFVNDDPNYTYRLSIGTDSMTYDERNFVLAVVLHRVGNGGIYFYKKFIQPAVRDLRTKLYTETQLSIDTTDLIVTELLERDENILDKLNLSIHLDIGQNGPTKDLIKELEGWIKAVGYDYEIKPDSYAASFVADKYSK